jgi:hypothetical protein
VRTRSLAVTLLCLGASACGALIGSSSDGPAPSGTDATDGAAEGAALGDGQAADAVEPPTDSGLGDGDPRGGDSGPDGSTPGLDAGCGGVTGCTRVVFVSSATYQGNLGGIAGADAKCQALADASVHKHVKGRTFLAWVSLNAPSSSPNARFVKGSAPYVLPGGTQVAASYAALVGSTHDNGIGEDENGLPVAAAKTWTGTQNTGDWVSPECVSWSSAMSGDQGKVGRSDFTASTWTDSASEPCNSALHLYCFEK